MYSMLWDDGKESNTAKGVNIAINSSKETLFNKKYSNTKWKELKVKNTSLVHMKSLKYHYRVLMIEDLF